MGHTMVLVDTSDLAIWSQNDNDKMNHGEFAYFNRITHTRNSILEMEPNINVG